MSEASYFYKNTSIYFNCNIPDEELQEFAIHECIHYIQERKNKKNKLIRMGISEYKSSQVYGIGLNEAAVQLMASMAIGIEKDYVKYFGISFETISPSYYPVECCLVSQLGYLLGEDLLFESTINSNDNFTNKFIEQMSLKIYLCIQNSIDKILEDEEKIAKYNNNLIELDDEDDKIESIKAKIKELKNNIAITFLKTQNIIISGYFNNEIKNIKTLEDVEQYRKKLCNFKNYIGTTEGYTYYHDYYIEKMQELEKINQKLEITNNTKQLQVINKKDSLFTIIINKIKKLFKKTQITDIQ